MIWIDADACPRAVKEIVYRAANRTRIPACLVANSPLSVPRSPLLSTVQVPKGFDVADHYILAHLSPGDIVVTADIPLAAEVVESGADALNPRGELYDAENVRERLSMRDFMQDLRDSGVTTGGPREFGRKDRERFAGGLDRLLARRR